MTDLRLLCMGDNHGNTSSLERVVEETEGEEFDFIVHVGDITNACLDGMEDGADQLSAVEPLFEQLADRGELVYVWGNRDFEVCSKGIGMRVDHHADFDFTPGTHVPRVGRIEIDGQDFTQDPDEVDEETILITHYFLPELVDDFPGRAYFSGHVHTGRFKNNVLNTAFLYRGNEHGAKPMEGGYFVVDLDDDEVEVSLHSLGGLTRGICSEDVARGVQFAPSNWRMPCTFCYDESDFYEEILESTKRRLEASGDDISQGSLIEEGLDQYKDYGVPRDFEQKLAEVAEEYV